MRILSRNSLAWRLTAKTVIAAPISRCAETEKSSREIPVAIHSTRLRCRCVASSARNSYGPATRPKLTVRSSLSGAMTMSPT
jgi:hypothetical protein